MSINSKEYADGIALNSLYWQDKLKREYNGKFFDTPYCILLHYPPNGAIKYLMESWCMIFEFMGIDCHLYPFWEEIDLYLDKYQPNIFITCADEFYLSQFDTQKLTDRGILIGHISGAADPIPIQPRHFIIDFFLDRQAPRNREGIPIHQFQFGCNPLIHHTTDLGSDYSWFYCGTISGNKINLVQKWIFPIMDKIKGGCVAGYGWDNFGIATKGLGIEEIPKYYSNTLVNLNLHQPGQIERYFNVNERTVIIPACGGFQILDNPKALPEFFLEDEVVSVSTPSEYCDAVEYFVKHPDDRLPYIEKALDRTFREHSLFHSLSRLIGFIGIILNDLSGVK